MRKGEFWLAYLLMTVAQMLLCNYFHVSPYVMLTILPVMVLCIPLRVPTWVTMFIAFATGFAVDLLAEGVLGLNVLALVPVAFVRKEVIRLIFGGELFARKEDFSVRKNGFGGVALAIFLVEALFLAVYIWADGAGTRPLSFNAIRFGASLLAGWALSLLVIDILAPDTRK
jgi:rod shape-determining protein MreD